MAIAMLKNHGIDFATSSVLFGVAFVLFACDGKNMTTSTAACPAGEERCACYANATCNDDLVCLSGVCVIDSLGVGGSTSLGGATSSTSTGNDQGGATAVGNGGATTVGNGGATTVGNGGATTVGNGGAVATGGTTSASVNLIKDGAFQSFDTYWNAVLQEGDSGTYTRPPTAAAVCVTNTSSSSALYYELSFTLGYPNSVADAFVIEPGATYTLTYTISATYPISLQVKIGHAVSPWTQVYAVTSDVLSTSYQTFSHQFTSSAGDTSAGLAFNAVLDLYGKMCFQQVSLVKN